MRICEHAIIDPGPGCCGGENRMANFETQRFGSGRRKEYLSRWAARCQYIDAGLSRIRHGARGF